MKPILTVTVTVFEDFGTPSCGTNTYDSSFEDVRKALKVAIDNLQGRLDAPEECPLNKPRFEVGQRVRPKDSKLIDWKIKDIETLNDRSRVIMDELSHISEDSDPSKIEVLRKLSTHILGLITDLTLSQSQKDMIAATGIPDEFLGSHKGNNRS